MTYIKFERLRIFTMVRTHLLSHTVEHKAWAKMV